MAEFQHGVLKIYLDYIEHDYIEYYEGVLDIQSDCVEGRIIISITNKEEKKYVSIFLTREEFVDIFYEVMNKTFVKEGDNLL